MASSEPTDDFDITKCSICLEEFNTPRCLPCLHTFCETCLNTYITSTLQQNNTTERNHFYCPVCQEPTKPQNSTASYQQWTGHFPINSFILTLIDQIKLINKQKLCDPCTFDNKNVTAVSWCLSCAEAFCAACTTGHKGSRLTRSHDLKNINEIKTIFPIESVQTCENHENKHVEAFCQDHDEPCCTTCLYVHHHKCNHLKTLEDAARGVLKSSDFDDLLQRLSDTSELNEGLINEKRENIQFLEKQKRDIEQELQEMRQRIISHFDNQRSKFMQDLDLVHHQRVTELSYAIEEVENRNKVILNCSRVMTTCKTRASETRVFLEMKRVLRKEKEQVERLDKIRNNHRRLKHLSKLDTNMEKMMSGFKSIGSTEVVENTSGLLISYPYFRPTCISTFSIKDKCGVDTYVYGGCFLPDSTLILPLCNAKTLGRFTYTGDLLSRSSKLSGDVFDVTTINYNTAVVTRPDMRVIDYINIDTLTVNKTVKVNYECHGITSSVNKLYVGCYSKLLVLDKDGSKVNEMHTKSGYIYGVTVINDKEKKVVYTNWINHSCHFVRLSDLKELYVFKHKELRHPYGVTSDREGKVYIAGRDSGNVLQVSTDGDLVRILITELFLPRGIQFDDISNRIFVSYSEPASVNIYKMIKL